MLKVQCCEGEADCAYPDENYLMRLVYGLYCSHDGHLYLGGCSDVLLVRGPRRFGKSWPCHVFIFLAVFEETVECR